MNYDWLIDVLADLEDFSEKNGLHELAASIEQARQVAVKEVPESSPSWKDEATSACFQF